MPPNLSNNLEKPARKTKKSVKTLEMSKNRCIFAPPKSPDGGIGRRAGLKHQWIHFHAGSIPALGTTNAW